MDDQPEGDDRQPGRPAYFHAYSDRRVSLRELLPLRRSWYREVVQHWRAHSEPRPSAARILPVPLTAVERALLQVGLKHRVEKRLLRWLAEMTPVQFEVRSWQHKAAFVTLRQPPQHADSPPEQPAPPGDQ